MKNGNIPEYIKNNYIMYCNLHGIVNYRIDDNRYLVYNVSFPADYFNFKQKYTVQHKVDLETMQEVSITPLKRFDKNGLRNGR